MSDDEKQPDNTLQQTEEPMAVNQDNTSGIESAATDEDLSATADLESSLKSDELTAEGSAPEVATDEGDMSEVEPVESATEGSSAEADLETLKILQQENQVLKAQLEEQNQKFMRMVADFENFRKRTGKEKEDLEHQVKRNTLSELLPVVDNFERARSQIKPQTDGEMSIHKSYQGVYKQLVDCLKRIGVSPMRPEGTEFDPNLHEAVMREATDEYSEGVVIEQLMRGYFLGDRVLRHAMVKVAAAPVPVVTSEDGTPEALDS
ncbi:MAG TPA: nucleotide exchange factor GrpE [Cyanobacteria bacterium UBA8803]|nr:nucleotide exchange factor GrpE [Cyanobacteria bacterium UBA9273]HBL57171.1 nucleotide exchange factor GrpE [Cyanobacteria bacterium UBA8803]